MQKIVVANGQYQLLPDGKFEITQGIQILNIDNFCNECGNCNTFCPTQGAPYKTKPKVFLTKTSFDEADNGYYLEKSEEETLLMGKNEGTVSTLLEKRDTFVFKNAQAEVVLLRADFSIQKVTLQAGFSNGTISLQEAARMHVILKGMSKLTFA